jgi:hypothetical protein
VKLDSRTKNVRAENYDLLPVVSCCAPADGTTILSKYRLPAERCYAVSTRLNAAKISNYSALERSSLLPLLRYAAAAL